MLGVQAGDRRLLINMQCKIETFLMSGDDSIRLSPIFVCVFCQWGRMMGLCFSGVTLALILSGCSRIQQAAPATLEEIQQTVCRLRSQGIVHGLGIFVGFKADDVDRVFLLTARHVATVGDVADTELHVDVGTNTNYTIRTERSRWDTTDLEYDYAWFELDEGEKARLRDVNGLRYIPVATNAASVTNACINGTGILDFARFCNDRREGNPQVTTFYRGGISRGEIAIDSYGVNTIFFPHNRNLKSCECPVVSCSSDVRVEEGDSGSPVFGLYKFGRTNYYLLTGLVNANSREANSSDFATQPLDQVVRYMGYVHIKLSRNESWW